MKSMISSFKTRSIQRATPHIKNKDTRPDKCCTALPRCQDTAQQQEPAIPQSAQQEVLFDQLHTLNELIIGGSAPFTTRYVEVRGKVIGELCRVNANWFKGKGRSVQGGGNVCVWCGMLVKGAGLRWECSHVTHKECGQCCPLQDVQ